MMKKSLSFLLAASLLSSVCGDEVATFDGHPDIFADNCGINVLLAAPHPTQGRKRL